MLEFPIEFFDDEVRDGFYVPSIMKHNWAAQMEVLNTVDQICKKNNIKYYIISGTLIGAIRHGGFIPWDDDVDICMLRKDYMRFVKAIMRDKPEKYYVRNCHVDPEYRDVFTRLQNDSEVETSPEFWEKGHGFVCNAGIDIFPLDYIPTNIEKRLDISNQLMHFYYILKKYDEAGLTDELNRKITNIENIFKVKITRDDTIPQQMYLLMEDVLCDINRAESKSVQIALNWAQNENMKGIPIECFKEQTRVPFEIAEFAAPYLYDKVLSEMFGNYMKSVRVCDIHDYPWYQPVLDIVRNLHGLSDYPFLCNLLPENNRHESWEKALISELNEHIKLFNDASVLAEKSFAAGDMQTGNMLLEKCQSLAKNAEKLENKLKKPEKERVVFIAWRSEYFSCFEPYYRYELEEGNDVYVIPAPFIRLTETRSYTDEYLELDGYPKGICITDYREFDFNEVRINRIYTQNIYDDQNGATLLSPFFYTSNLSKFTDELIYIPWFELDKYGDEDERAIYMQQFFIRQPGIVAVDRIYLPKSQEWLKEHYIKDLIKWAGEDTRDIWENKIDIVSFDEEASGQIQVDSNLKKVLFYYISTGQILADPDNMMEKMIRNLEIFDSGADKIVVKLFIENGLIDNFKKFYPEKIEKFTNVCSEYKEKQWCDYIEATEPIDVNNKEMMKTFIDTADAFYGDGGVIMHFFERAKKPVMLQNVSI